MCWQEIYGFALVLLGFGSGAAVGPLVAIIPIRLAEDFQILVLFVLLVFPILLLVFVTRDWYLLVFLHVLLYFVRKPTIYIGF